ncbi:MAG: hypothetical protein IKY98_02060 [Alphaproteobacteria bacterium]|nr:hypothetical protein [Alphaproteobacteria bacterium]
MAKLNKNGDFNSINKDTMPLDTRVKHEYDNLESFSCHSGLRAGIQRGDYLMPKAFRFDQSGRSMVEMLGTLAIIGVLSIGGIMGYSYAVDKYHANQIMNDVNLRGIDLIAQASRGGDFSLAEWPTKTSGDLDIGLEVDEATNTTEGGIYVKDVEKRICEIIADDLLPEEVELVIDGESYVSGTCGETNKMVFYYDAVAEALGGGNQNCVETENGCVSCPAGATLSADKTTCECPNGLEWDKDENECTTSCKEAMIEAGFDEAIFTVDGNTIVITGEATRNMESTSPIDANHCDLKLAATPGSTIQIPSMKVKSFTCATEGISLKGYGATVTVLSISSGQMNLEPDCRYLTIGDLSMSSVDMTVREGTVVSGTTLNNVNIVSASPDDTLTIKNSTIENSTIESDYYFVSDNNTLLKTTVNCKEFYSTGNNISGATITADNITFNYDTIMNTLTATASEKIELNSASIEVEDDDANITFTTQEIGINDCVTNDNSEKIKVVVPSDDPCNIIVDGACVGPNNPFAS